MPFSQLYQPPDANVPTKIYGADWKAVNRKWSRPLPTWADASWLYDFIEVRELCIQLPFFTPLRFFTKRQVACHDVIRSVLIDEGSCFTHPGRAARGARESESAAAAGLGNPFDDLLARLPSQRGGQELHPPGGIIFYAREGGEAIGGVGHRRCVDPRSGTQDQGQIADLLSCGLSPLAWIAQD